MLHQNFSESELECHESHQTRQLFMGIWGKALGVTMRSAMTLEESAASIYFHQFFSNEVQMPDSMRLLEDMS